MENRFNKIFGDKQSQKYELGYDNEIFKELSEIGFYQKVPEMIPFVGNKYKVGKGTLLVCKNYSVPSVQEKQLNHDADEWYELSIDKLNNFLNPENASDWINLRCHMSNAHPGWVWYKLADHIIESNHKPFGEIPNYNPGDEIKQEHREVVYKHLSLMNYFTRPGTLSTDIDISEQDKHISYSVFTKVVGILKPKVIVFFGDTVQEVFSDSDRKEPNESQINSDIEIVNLYSPSAIGRGGYPSKALKDNLAKEISKFIIK